MKRFKSLSVVLASALLVSSIPMTTFGVTEGGEINGGGTIIDGYVLDVDVPTEVPFVVNPQEFGVQISGNSLTGQIISPGYAFRNRSSMPIQLDIIPSFASADGITIVTSEDEILNTNNEGHKIYLEVQPASVKATVNGGATNEVSAPAIVPETNYATGPAITAEPSAKMSFKLDAATYVVSGNAVTYDPGSFASDDAVAFKFGGKVSKYSKWEDKVINIKVKYDFGTISDADYDDADNVVAGRYNVLNTDLLNNGPGVLADKTGLVKFTNADEFKIFELEDGSMGYNARVLSFIYSPTPINTSTIVLDDVKVGETINGLEVIKLDPIAYEFDIAAGEIQLNDVGVSSLANSYVVFFVEFWDADDNPIIVRSDAVKFD